MNSTVPLPEPEVSRTFARVAEIYFPPAPRSRDLPLALQLENGSIVCVKLPIAQIANLLGQLARMGNRAPE